MTDVLREVVLPRLTKVRPSGGGFTAACPAHKDSKPSLTLSAGKEHPVVLRCQAGCSSDDVLAALGLTWTDLSKPNDRRADGDWTPAGPAVAVYDYVDEVGTLLFQVLRTANKEFRQRVPDPTAKSGWRWSLGETRRVIYRLPAVIRAVTEGRIVWICEGEKDVQSLESRGQVATCNPGGAGKWRPEYGEVFRDAVAMIVADRDDAGQAHARMVRDQLEAGGANVTIFEPLVGKDVSDHLGAGQGLEDLVLTYTTDTAGTRTDLAPDLWEFLGASDPGYVWVIPGLLEHGDRLMLTGYEGLGKSMLVRQLAVAAAAGLHPFTLAEIEAKTVLFIDLENSERLSRRKFRPIAEATVKLGRRLPDGAVRIIHKPAGIDLTRPDDAAWLIERVTAHRPDVLFVGPFYRLHCSNMNEELPARKAVAVLDAARMIADCALVVEAHSGHADAGIRRSVRPVGSSLLLRWPEFGYGLQPATDRPEDSHRHVRVLAWRGARDERKWPTNLTWGADGLFPWRVTSERELAEIA